MPPTLPPSPLIPSEHGLTCPRVPEVVSERPGDGKTFPKKGDMLTMHYHGSLASTGAKFDSSYDRGSPFKFQIGVGQVGPRAFPLLSLTSALRAANVSRPPLPCPTHDQTPSSEDERN